MKGSCVFLYTICSLVWIEYTCNASTLPKPKENAWESLALALKPRFRESSTDSIAKALSSLSSSQSALKGMDGVAHAAYYKLRQNNDVASVSGRAQRSATRVKVVSQALEACQLVELVEIDNEHLIQEFLEESDNRELILNTTKAMGGMNIKLVVFHEDKNHTSASAEEKHCKGRLVVVIGETNASYDIGKLLRMLEKKVFHLKLNKGMVTDEAASVQGTLYKAANVILSKVEPHIRHYNASSIHFVGRSLGGGVAALAASILEGSLPEKKRPPLNNATNPASFQSLAKGRVSCFTLGAPPCMSPNVHCDFVTSMVFGDDLVCRTSPASIERLVERTRKALGRGTVARQLNRWVDTVSLAAQNVREHAHGSQGEEARLSVPGKAFLVRPRQQGHSTIHEIGSQLKGGREALRSAVLFQLNDVLLSKSLWKHHKLDSYIHGIDRVHLRGLEENEEDQ